MKCIFFHFLFHFHFIVHVGWSEWSQWSTCSVTCDMGLQHRTRTCTNPPQRPEGNHCLGVNSDTQLCMPAPCANGGWSDWTSWSTCSSTCGGGIRSQSRSCSNPHPSPYGQYCVGSNDRVETCARDNCETKHCSSNPCVHGQCFEVRHDFLCLCNPGKTGRYCNISTGAFLCSMQPCIEGTCVPGINNYTCKCNQGYRGRNCDIVNATDCYDILHYNIGSTSGVYNVSLWRSKLVKEVFCDMDTDKGGWTVFQNRFDGSVNFTRTFKEYIDGFGSYRGEYWLGLKYIEEMTSHGTTKLRIELSGVDNSVAYRVFRNFSLGVNPGYELHINRGTGHEGDLFGLFYNKGLPFSTYDHDNMNGCGKRARGGWWYSNCTNANLNGEYLKTGSRHGEQGMFYYNFKKAKSLKSSRMMFRRMNFW